MSTNAAITTQLSRTAKPIKGLMAAAINHWEQWSHWQLTSSQIYCDIGFEQLRKMATITDLEQAQAFSWNQIEPMSAINKQLLSDWQTWVNLHNQCKNDISAVFSASSATPKATSTKPASTDKKTTNTSKPMKTAGKKSTSDKADKAPTAAKATRPDTKRS